DVAEAGRDCRSALSAVRRRPGCGRETIPRRPAVAARDGPAGRRGARRSLSGFTAGEIHHRGESRYWRNTAGLNLIGKFELWGTWDAPAPTVAVQLNCGPAPAFGHTELNSLAYL